MPKPPSRKKLKLHKNVPDTDSASASGGPSDSDARKGGRKRKRVGKSAASAPGGSSRGAFVPSTASSLQQAHSSKSEVGDRGSGQEDGGGGGGADPQIQGFVSQQELARYARSLKLKRIMLADLREQSDLEKAYVGGQVMGHYSKSYSQGHDLNIFIQDESTTQGSQPKHLKVSICGELAGKMPALRDDAKLFVCNAVVKEDSCDFSQDHGKCLLMEGAEARVWIVHKDVQKDHFFSETCGKRWWSKTKQNREKIQMMW